MKNEMVAMKREIDNAIEKLVDLEHKVNLGRGNKDLLSASISNLIEIEPTVRNEVRGSKFKPNSSANGSSRESLLELGFSIDNSSIETVKVPRKKGTRVVSSRFRNNLSKGERALIDKSRRYLNSRNGWCNNPKIKHYKAYGARGFTIEPLWIDKEKGRADSDTCVEEMIVRFQLEFGKDPAKWIPFLSGEKKVYFNTLDNSNKVISMNNLFFGNSARDDSSEFKKIIVVNKTPYKSIEHAAKSEGVLQSTIIDMLGTREGGSGQRTKFCFIIHVPIQSGNLL